MNHFNKIITSLQTEQVASKLHSDQKKIVLVGGCFDILHIGHLSFLEKAKEKGDVLIVFLENDKRIKHIKGEDRPINSQEDRARMLASLYIVDYIILLPENMDDTMYDKLILQLKPAIIATTKQDPNRAHKERQAKLVGCQVVDVITKVENASTSRIANLLKQEL